MACDFNGFFLINKLFARLVEGSIVRLVNYIVCLNEIIYICMNYLEYKYSNFYKNSELDDTFKHIRCIADAK